MIYEWILLNVWWDKRDGSAWQKSCGASEKWLTYNRKIKNAPTCCFFFLLSVFFVLSEIKWRCSEVWIETQLRFAEGKKGKKKKKRKKAWPVFFFLNEWKWPTLWACMNLNEVTKGILCNSVLFDLETAPVLIPSRTGGMDVHIGPSGGSFTASGGTTRLSGRQAKSGRCMWVRRVRMHACVRKLWHRGYHLANRDVHVPVAAVSYAEKDWEKPCNCIVSDFVCHWNG